MAPEGTTRRMRVDGIDLEVVQGRGDPVLPPHGNQADTDRYFGVLDGSVPIEQFFAPSNVERIVAAAAPVLSTAA